MGIALFQLHVADYDALRSLIDAHESSVIGPRARGYWTDADDLHDYAGTRATAQTLYRKAADRAIAQLELTENEAHSLSMLEIELPGDSLDFAPSLFMSGAAPDQIRKNLKIAARKLGPTPEIAADRLDIVSDDPRYAGYLLKQVKNLRTALPKVWRFYENALRVGDAVVSVDLRARDLEIPEPVELAY